MSVTSLLKNIYSFLDVLQNAHSMEVQTWTEQDVTNALKWAEYCQMIQCQSIGKTYAENLDRQIRTLGQLPWALGDVDICLGFLREARFLIQKTLLQNPYLPEHLFTTVVEMSCESDGINAVLKSIPTFFHCLEELKVSYFNTIQGKKILQSIIVPKISVHQLLLLMRRLSSNCHDDDIVRRVSLECEASLLHRHFEHVFRTCTNHDRLKTYMFNQLEAIMNESSGMDIILRCLLVDEGPGKTTFQHKSLMVTWLNSQIQTSKDVRYSLKTCSPDLLCSVALRYELFEEAYLQWLTEWACDMTIQYTPTKSPGYCYSPRSEHFSAFKDLASHFLQLLRGREKQKMVVVDLIRSKSSRSEVSVWVELRKYLIKNI